MTVIHRDAEVRVSKALNTDRAKAWPFCIVMDHLSLHSFWVPNPVDAVLNLQAKSHHVGAILKFRCAKVKSFLISGIDSPLL